MPIDCPPLVAYQTPRWNGYVHPALVKCLDQQDIHLGLLELPHERMKERHNVANRRIITDIGDAVLRVESNPKRKWLSRSRVLQTLAIQTDMDDAGITVPPIILALKGEGIELFAALFEPGPSMLQLLKRCSATQGVDALLPIAARAAAHLHGQRFIHGDLIPGNMLYDESTGRLAFIDNERTTRPIPPLRRLGRRRNLTQMSYRLLGLTGHRGAMIFLEQYDQYAPAGMKNGAVERQAILDKAAARMARNAHRRTSGFDE